MVKPIMVLVLLALAFGPGPTNAESPTKLWSVESLRIACSTKNAGGDDICTEYIHGVVEAWFVRDLAGVDPERFSSNKRFVFCETILKVSDDEWKRIVRARLQKDRDPGFAAEFVIESLHDQLCK